MPCWRRYHIGDICCRMCIDSTNCASEGDGHRVRGEYLVNDSLLWPLVICRLGRLAYHLSVLNGDRSRAGNPNGCGIKQVILACRPNLGLCTSVECEYSLCREKLLAADSVIAVTGVCRWPQAIGR